MCWLHRAITIHEFHCLSIRLNVKSISIERRRRGSAGEDLPGQVGGVRGSSWAAVDVDSEFSTGDWLSRWALHSGLVCQIRSKMQTLSPARCRVTGSEKHCSSVIGMIQVNDPLCRCVLSERLCSRHCRTVNSPWCICQAGRGRGRFLDGPCESFQWCSPARLSARSSLPAPALGSLSSSYSGHFEQLKENKGLGLGVDNEACKWMTWSSRQTWTLVDGNAIKGILKKEQQKFVACKHIFFFRWWLFERCSKLSSYINRDLT